MRSLVPVLVAMIVVFGAGRDVAAAPPKGARTGELRFLTASPGGPLAQVLNGAVRTPPRRACRSWGAIGSRWRELDAFGVPVGEAVVESGNYYDASNCDELTLRRTGGVAGAGFYVDARAPYRAPDVVWWRPSKSARAALERIVSARQKRFTLLGGPGPSLRALTLFFAWGETRERFAAVGGRSLVILKAKGDGWQVVHEQPPSKGKGLANAYRPLGVTDMNGDGLPELVVHEIEDVGEWWGDGTFTELRDGTWKRIGPGIFGSTA